MLNRLEQGLIV